MDDYSGKEKLKAARSVAVDLDVEARVSVGRCAHNGDACPMLVFDANRVRGACSLEETSGHFAISKI